MRQTGSLKRALGGYVLLFDPLRDLHGDDRRGDVEKVLSDRQSKGSAQHVKRSVKCL